MTSKTGLTCRDKLATPREQFIRIARRRIWHPSSKLATETLNYLRSFLLTAKYGSTEELIRLLTDERKLVISKSDTRSWIVSNVALSVLKMVREESLRLKIGSEEFTHESFTRLVGSSSFSNEVPIREVKRSVLATIIEYGSEIETCKSNIAAQAVEYINDGEIVLTHSLHPSSILEAFFETARKQRRFRLRFIRGGVDYAEHVNDEAALDVLPSVNIVILSAVVVFADGACVAPTGSLNICLAAKQRSIPVHFCVPFYKMTPFSSFDWSRYIPLAQSDAIISTDFVEDYLYTQTLQSALECIPAELVSSYICHTSAVPSSGVKNFLGDYYHLEDIINTDS